MQENTIIERFESKTKADLCPEYLEIFETWKKAVSREHPVTLVFGKRSDQKSLLITLMGLEFKKLLKSTVVVYEWDIEAPPLGFLIILMLADLQQQKVSQFIGSYLSKHIFLGKALIIESENLANLKVKYDDSFVNFLQAKCIEIQCPQIKPNNIII